MKLPLTLYPRLFLPLAASLMLAVGLAWWVSTSLLGDALERRLDAQLEHALEVLVDGGIPLTRDLLERMARLLRADILLLAADGSPGVTTLDAAQADLRRTLLATLDPATQPSLDVEVDAVPYRVISRPLIAGRDSRYAAVVIVASLEDVRRAAQGTAAWIGASSAIILVALAWLAHRATRGVTDRIQQAGEMAERIAGGDRNVRVAEDEHDEMGALGRALNRMAVRLADYEREQVDQNRLAALGEMAARVAHEIRNPLTAIKLHIELLLERLDGEPRTKLTAILDEVRRLELIVTTAVEVGRPQRISTAATDLSEVTREVTRLMRPQLAHRGIRLETRLRNLPPARLDADRVKQVLLNLLANASNALPDGGVVRVSTEYLDGEAEVVLEVEDSGPGLPQDPQDPPAEGAGGLGVGLRLSTELVELHGGFIRTGRSDALGGACLSVHFPGPPTSFAAAK